MCGIAGLINFKSLLAPDPIGTMTRTLRHRGPDDEGYIAAQIHCGSVKVTRLHGPDSTVQSPLSLDKFAGGAHLYLGHRRLAILDLSAAGHQPMERNGLWIVFNGEIYNYIELREELKAAGHEFSTRTDTEVILAAYDEWGEECVSRFNGDWAFCILDTRRRTLFLSRDRYGIKPLYFTTNGDHFAFASEIKAILMLPFLKRSLNHELAFQHCFLHCRDHTEQTLFAGISQLMPGRNLSIDLQTGKSRKSFYYALSSCPELGKYDHHTAIKHASNVRDLLNDSVSLRLRADVPVGMCLSGGIDSSVIAVISARLLGQDVSKKVQNTFTATFPGEVFDERHYAQLIIEHSGVKSHWIHPSQEGYLRELPAILRHQDEPFGGTSIYAQWEVMQEASKHVKVVLDGQGGDEVFGGYRDYHTSFLAQLLLHGRVGSFSIEMLSSIVKQAGLKKTLDAVKSLLIFISPNFWKRSAYRFRYRDDFQSAQRFVNATGQCGLEHIDKKFKPHLNELLYHYLTAYSLPQLLKYEDRNSMAHSIEARVPFTDYRLVDYMFSIPPVFKIRHGWTKWLLRLAVKDLLPAEIVWRKDKLGFATPPWASRRDIWDAWMGDTFRDHETKVYQSPGTLMPSSL
jgi:asparagine synthase (glutamine-hydrolysing)